MGVAEGVSGRTYRVRKGVLVNVNTKDGPEYAQQQRFQDADRIMDAMLKGK